MLRALLPRPRRLPGPSPCLRLLSWPLAVSTQPHPPYTLRCNPPLPQTWADTFLSELNDTHVEAELRTRNIPPALDPAATVSAYRSSRRRLLVLGYNATLTTAVEAPRQPKKHFDQIQALTRVNPAAYRCLAALAHNPDTQVGRGAGGPAHASTRRAGACMPPGQGWCWGTGDGLGSLLWAALSAQRALGGEERPHRPACLAARPRESECCGLLAPPLPPPPRGAGCGVQRQPEAEAGGGV